MENYKPLEKDVSPNVTIDAKGLFSPIPLLRLKKELAVLQSKEIARLDSTDPGTGNDIAGWCTKVNNIYLGEKRESGFSSFFVMKE